MNVIYHSGIKGQKWGIRRWQYKDGTLTPEGYPHYGYNGPRKKAVAKTLEQIGPTLKKGFESKEFKDRLGREVQDSMFYDGGLDEWKEIYTETIKENPLYYSDSTDFGSKKITDDLYKNLDILKTLDKKQRYNEEIAKLLPSADELIEEYVTPEAMERHDKLTKYRNDVYDIVDSMNEQDRNWLSDRHGFDLDYDEVDSMIERGSAFIEYEQDTPVSFLYVQTGLSNGNVVVGTRDGDEYRNKGYASKNIEKAKEWLETNDEGITNLYWSSYMDNVASQNLAKKSGFNYNSEDLDTYEYKLSRTRK